VVNHLKKYEDLAAKLRKESDLLRADIMFKEPGFGMRELLPQNYCDFHGEGGHSGSRWRYSSSGKQVKNSDLKNINGSKFKKMETYKMETDRYSIN